MPPLVAQSSDDWQATLRAGEQALANADYDRAEQIFSAAADRARGFGETDGRRAQALVHLARVYRAEGDLAKPEELYREASPVALAAYGADSAEYGRFLNEVGRYYHSRRKYEIAERFYRDAFGARVRALGREHLDVAESINNLAVLFENQMRFDKAEVYYQTALDIRRKLLGPDHVQTVETHEHFARLLVKMQKAEAAAEHTAAARAGRRKLLDAAAPPPVDLGADLLSRPGPNIEPPKLDAKVEPRYTEEARIARHEGSVGLEIDIDADGVPRNVTVTQILGLGLDEQAIEAVRQWRFEPARRNQKKIPFRAQLEVSFRLL